jgi:hypothetical protein
MGINRWQFGVVTALLVVLVWIQAFPLLFPQRAAPGVEYRIESVPDLLLLKSLDNWGSAGWELVFARRALDDDRNGLYEVIMKRPL